MLNRTIAPGFNQVDHITLIKPGQVKYSNGCNLFHFNSGDQELVRIEWIFGNLRFDIKKPLLNMAVNAMLAEGTEKLTAAQIADRVDYYGAFLQTDYGYDNCTVTLYTLNKHLEKTLPIVHDILNNAIFPEKEIDTFRMTYQQKLQIGLQKMMCWPADSLIARYMVILFMVMLLRFQTISNLIKLICRRILSKCISHQTVQL